MTSVHNIAPVRELKKPPKSICILRLSAIGDVCHALPVVRSIQNLWPTTSITWIIGQTEYELLSDIDDIHFVVFDKKAGLKAFFQLKKSLKNKQFDLLLHMQTSLRSNIASLFIPATIKLGYDKNRAKELHYWVTNRKIPSTSKHQHQIDDLFGFAMALGAKKQIAWNIPIQQKALHKIKQQFKNKKPLLIISPCSSPSKRIHRSWNTANYARVADYAIESLGYDVVLSGGPTQHELRAGKEIETIMHNKPANLIGKTSLKELLALMSISALLITSDSGPSHIATALNLPVIALHAATNPYQTGPYLWLDWVINKYPEAVEIEYQKKPEQLAWGTRVHNENIMALITAEKVIHQLIKMHSQGIQEKQR